MGGRISEKYPCGKYFNLESIHAKEIAQRRELLEDLKIWCNGQKPIPKTILDHQLVEFLNAADYDNKQAQQLILNHYKIKRKHASLLFDDRDPFRSEIQAVWNVMRLISPVKTTQEGYRVVYFAMIDKNPKVFNLVPTFQLINMCIEASLICDGLYPGYVLVGNASGLTFHHMPLTNLFTMKKILSYAQYGLPIKVRAVHVVNMSKMGEKLYYFIRPLLTKEIVDMVHIYFEENTASIFKNISRDLLPDEIGGNVRHSAAFQKLTRLKVETLQEWFATEENQRKKLNKKEPDIDERSISEKTLKMSVESAVDFEDGHGTTKKKKNKKEPTLKSTKSKKSLI